MRVRRNEGGRRDDDQTFYRSVLSELSESPHYLRVDETGRLAIRAGQRWQTYGQKQQGEFWRYLLRADADLRTQNWSTVRQQQFWQYVLITKDLSGNNACRILYAEYCGHLAAPEISATDIGIQNINNAIMGKWK